MPAKEPILSMRNCQDTGGHTVFVRLEEQKGELRQIMQCAFCNYTRIKNVSFDHEKG